MRPALASFCLLVLSATSAWAWGQEGHSIIAESAQRRLTPNAIAEVARLLGPNHSLASVGSWADNERDRRPETYNWHFVDISAGAGSGQSRNTRLSCWRPPPGQRVRLYW